MNPLANCPCQMHTADREAGRHREFEHVMTSEPTESWLAVSVAGVALLVALVALYLVLA